MQDFKNSTCVQISLLRVKLEMFAAKKAYFNLRNETKQNETKPDYCDLRNRNLLFRELQISRNL